MKWMSLFSGAAVLCGGMAALPALHAEPAVRAPDAEGKSQKEAEKCRRGFGETAEKTKTCYACLFSETEVEEYRGWAESCPPSGEAAEYAEGEKKQSGFWRPIEERWKKKALENLKKQGKEEAFLKTEKAWEEYREQTVKALAASTPGAEQWGRLRALIARENLYRTHCAVLYRMTGEGKFTPLPQEPGNAMHPIRVLAGAFVQQVKVEKKNQKAFDDWSVEMRAFLPVWSAYTEGVRELVPDKNAFADDCGEEILIMLRELVFEGFARIPRQAAAGKR